MYKNKISKKKAIPEQKNGKHINQQLIEEIQSQKLYTKEVLTQTKNQENENENTTILLMPLSWQRQKNLTATTIGKDGEQSFYTANWSITLKGLCPHLAERRTMHIPYDIPSNSTQRFSQQVVLI